MNNMPTISPDIDREVRAISRTLQKVISEQFPEIRLPIIAGGAIRDGVLCRSPKDYDIFIDLSPYETPEEAEDQLLLIADALAKEMGRTASEAGEDYGGLKAENESDDPFIVYNLQPVHWLNPAVNYQLIGRRTPLLSTDPLEWVTKQFDYSMVKALFDPLDGEYKFSKEFLNAWDTKTVVFNTQASWERAMHHFQRVGSEWVVEKVWPQYGGKVGFSTSLSYAAQLFDEAPIWRALDLVRREQLRREPADNNF